MKLNQRLALLGVAAVMSISTLAGPMLLLARSRLTSLKPSAKKSLVETTL